jgi:glycosyltransferase involved in cell wall biosynthesis
VLATVIIPAHNEEFKIGRLLREFGDLRDELDAVVVCNGCTDRTASVVADVAPWAKLIELDRGSKPEALRAGDAAVEGMPRLYLDADVVISGNGVRRLAATLADDGDLVAVAPTPRYDTDAANPIVRSHYRIWSALYTNIDALYGTGAIMVSAAGRARFDQWPDIIADDYYVDGLFAETEKRRLADVEVVVELPRTFRACVSRKARVYQGNREVQAARLRAPKRSAATIGGSLAALLRAQPRLLVHVPAHLLVTLAGRIVGAWRRRRGTARRFYRDPTTRG